MGLKRIVRFLVICIAIASAVSCTLTSSEDAILEAAVLDAGMVMPPVVPLSRIDPEIPEFYHDDRYEAGTVVVLSQRYEPLEWGVRPVTVAPDISPTHELFIRRATAVPSTGAIDVLTVAPDAAYDQNSKLLLYTALSVRDDDQEVREFRTTLEYAQLPEEDQRRERLVLYEVWEYKGFGRGYALAARFTLGVSYHIPRSFAALCWEADGHGGMSAHIIWDNDG